MDQNQNWVDRESMNMKDVYTILFIYSVKMQYKNSWFKLKEETRNCQAGAKSQNETLKLQ